MQYRQLSLSEHHLYAGWMKSRNAESRRMYFGIAVTDESIDQLVQGILDRPHKNNFIVAYDQTGWCGTIHLAATGQNIEFGLMIREDRRGQGIASELLEQGLIWARNRGFDELFMHCLKENAAIRHLCIKHGLEVTNIHTESESKLKLPPPNWATVMSEAATVQKQLWTTLLNPKSKPYKESAYG